MVVEEQEDGNGTSEEDKEISTVEQLNKVGSLLCERLKEFPEMPMDDKLKSLENMVEHVRRNKGDETKLFQALKESRGSKGPLTKANNDKEG